jgi:hypothetical protein
VPGHVIQYKERLQHDDEVERRSYSSESCDHYSCDFEEASSPPNWPGMVALGVGGLLAIILFLILLVNVDDQTRTHLLIGITALAVVGLIAAVVAAIKGCSFWEALGWTLLGIGTGFVAVFLVLFGVVAALGKKEQTTLRPLNVCGACGYEWYPRGRDYSVRCPNCGRER